MIHHLTVVNSPRTGSSWRAATRAFMEGAANVFLIDHLTVVDSTEL
jgi:hypothetical protein